MTATWQDVSWQRFPISPGLFCPTFYLFSVLLYPNDWFKDRRLLSLFWFSWWQKQTWQNALYHVLLQLLQLPRCPLLWWWDHNCRPCREFQTRGEGENSGPAAFIIRIYKGDPGIRVHLEFWSKVLTSVLCLTVQGYIFQILCERDADNS